MRIDSHQHFWRLARGDYGWLTPDRTAIYRDFGPDDLTPLLMESRIDRTVLIQAAPTTAETEFLLRLADETPIVAGVVGWIDFDAYDAVDQVMRLADRPALLGLRPMIQDIADPDWMLRSHMAEPLQAMAAAGVVFDALVTPSHLPNLLRFLCANDHLSVVIDHGAKPAIAEGGFREWARDMRWIAAGTGAVCKLSGLITEARPDWDVESLRPYVDVLLGSFGPERLMWGSDWPVLNLNGTYSAWLGAAEVLLADLSPAEQEMVFGDVACRIYGIGK